MALDPEQIIYAMIKRLCLGVVLPWGSFAVTYGCSDYNVDLFQRIFLPTCISNAKPLHSQALRHISCGSLEIPPNLMSSHRSESRNQQSSDRLPDAKFQRSGYISSSHASNDDNVMINEAEIQVGPDLPNDKYQYHCHRDSQHEPVAQPQEGHAQTKELSDKFHDLVMSIKTGEFFNLDDSSFLALLSGAFETELEYLKSAYAIDYPADSNTVRKFPSEVLFNYRYPEIDRTLTGVFALRWIYRRERNSFIQSQKPGAELRPDSFEQLCDLFHIELNNFKDPKAVLTLVILQMTNDLGKSSELRKILQERISRAEPGQRVSDNHDIMMSQVIERYVELVPSYQHIPEGQRETVRRLITLSAQFNPAQLVQAECPVPALESILDLKITPREMNMKFMEIFLDVSGALGHKIHEGAAIMNEQTFHGYWDALSSAMKISQGRWTPKQAYMNVLRGRLTMLQNSGYQSALNYDIETDKADFAKARLFCMGRVGSPDTAEMFNNVLQSLEDDELSKLIHGLDWAAEPAVQPTYFPGMLSQALATSNPQQALRALLRYLARVVHLTGKDLRKLPSNAVIVERDVKDILEPLIKKEKFNKNPGVVVHTRTRLPELVVVKKREVESDAGKTDVEVQFWALHTRLRLLFY